MPDLYLNANPTPSGTNFPGTVDALFTLAAQYLSVNGLGGFRGINFGATVPLAADRDKPWFETTASGDPVAWKTWNGSEWVEITYPVPSGSTSSRPSNPVDGQTFFDTDINTALIWERAAWRTLDGVPGDIKYCEAATIDDAETNNPGWFRVADYYGRTIVAAGAGAGLTSRAFADTGGQELETAHSHSLPANTGGHTLTASEQGTLSIECLLDDGDADLGTQQSIRRITIGGTQIGDDVGTSGTGNLNAASTSHTHPIGGNTGNHTPGSNMQPFICAWLIRKA